MWQAPEYLGMKEYHSQTCVNCTYNFESENQSRAKHFSFLGSTFTNGANDDFLEKEIQIIDAIYYIFGLHFNDLSLDNNYVNECLEVVALCSECIPVFYKLYDSFKDFKKVSQDNSLLWNSVKWKRSMVSVKSEVPSLDSTGTAGNLKVIDLNNDSGHLGHLEVTSGGGASRIGDDFFDDSYMVHDDETPDSIFDPVLDDSEYKNVKPSVLLRHSLKAKSTSRRKTIKSRMGAINAKRRHKFRKRHSKIKRISGENFQWQIEHLDSLIGAAPIKCCNVRFETDIDFISHVTKNHRNESEKLEQECGICKRKMLSKYLDFHMKVLHQDLSVFQCSTCQKTFSTKTFLRKHRQKSHKVPGGKKAGTRVFCEECQKYYEYWFFYKCHLPVTHRKNDEKFQCEFCGRNLNSEKYLKYHVQLYHSGDKEGKCCDKCGKVFTNTYNLSRHKRIHEADLITDKEQFKCSQCGITLKHNTSLRKHMYLMHGKAALKTYSCEICGKITKSMTNMRIHMKVHDPNKNLKHSKTTTDNVTSVLLN